MRLIFKLFLILMIGSSALANNKVGNGGNGVFCKSGKTETGTLLDFYEGDMKVQSSMKNPMDIAAFELARLKSVAPKLSAQYIQRLNEIQKEIDFKDNVVLATILDSNHLFVPADANCQVIQVAIRKADALPSEKRFLIRKDLWQKMMPADQAGLITHEIIYEHFSKLGETDSIKARKMNRYLYQDDKREDFWRFIQELKIPIYP